MNRDNFFRCKHCGELFPDDQCILDPVLGLKCPKGCEESYEQPPYESPLNESTVPSKNM